MVSSPGVREPAPGMDKAGAHSAQTPALSYADRLDAIGYYVTCAQGAAVSLVERSGEATLVFHTASGVHTATFDAATLTRLRAEMAVREQHGGDRQLRQGHGFLVLRRMSAPPVPHRTVRDRLRAVGRYLDDQVGRYLDDQGAWSIEVLEQSEGYDLLVAGPPADDRHAAFRRVALHLDGQEVDAMVAEELG